MARKKVNGNKFNFHTNSFFFIIYLICSNCLMTWSEKNSREIKKFEKFYRLVAKWKKGRKNEDKIKQTNFKFFLIFLLLFLSFFCFTSVNNYHLLLLNNATTVVADTVKSNWWMSLNFFNFIKYTNKKKRRLAVCKEQTKNYFLNGSLLQFLLFFLTYH